MTLSADDIQAVAGGITALGGFTSGVLVVARKWANDALVLADARFQKIEALHEEARAECESRTKECEARSVQQATTILELRMRINRLEEEVRHRLTPPRGIERVVPDRRTE
jgi:hypothetical protein